MLITYSRVTRSQHVREEQLEYTAKARTLLIVREKTFSEDCPAIAKQYNNY